MDKDVNLTIAVFLIVPLLIISGCAKAPDGNLENEWLTLKQDAISQVSFSKEWSNAQLLDTPINTIGWEDGVFVSADGKTIYFTYFQGDLLNYIITGLKDYDKLKRGPKRGINPAGTLDLFYSNYNGNSWSEPQKFSYCEDLWSEGGISVEGNDYYYMSNKQGGFGGDDIYMNGQNIGTPVNSAYNEEDPHVNGDELFFWRSSSELVVLGERSIWVSRKENGYWQEPIKLSETINKVGAENMQPFFASDGKLYFASNRDGTYSIYSSERLGFNEWAKPEKVVWPSGDTIIAVGLPSMPSGMERLYFIAIFKNSRNEFDSDIAYAERII